MREKVIIGYKGEIGSALSIVFEAEYGIDLNDDVCFKYKELGTEDRDYYSEIGVPKGLIIHICIKFDENFITVVKSYIEKLKPKLVIIHSTVAPGTTKTLLDVCNWSVPIVHAPINGQHPKMINDIKIQTMFVGADKEEWGNTVCEYFEYFGLKTYLCSSSEQTEFTKLASTEILYTIVHFLQDMKAECKNRGLNWAEFVAFFEKIGRPIFQRAGPIDTEMSGKHCLNNNHYLLKKLGIVKEND